MLPLLVIGAYGLQSTLLGLTWGFEVTFPVPVLAGFAVLIPPLTYAALTSLAQVTTDRRAIWLVAPAICTAGFVLLFPFLGISQIEYLLDVVIVAIYLFYGGLMMRIAFIVETDWMDQLPFQRLPSAGRTFLVAGAAMFLSATVEIIVFMDLAHGSGTLAPEVVGLSNLLLLIALGVAVLWMSGTPPPVEEKTARPVVACEGSSGQAQPVGLIDGMSTEEYRALQQATLEKLDDYMMTHQLYRDENLSLDRLARRTLIPTRQISTAINNLRAINVPQYVNTFRVIEACELLKQTDAPVTEIIYDVGFTTKSNFNREFQRVVGVSPSVWRRSNKYDSKPSSWPFVESFFEPTTAPCRDFSLHRAEAAK